MKLSSLEHLQSFALLGPGFCEGKWVLLTDLVDTTVRPQLIYAPFECPGNAPRQLQASDQGPIQIEFEAISRNQIGRASCRERV